MKPFGTSFNPWRAWAVLVAILTLSGCLDFGEDNELSGAAFDAAKVEEVASITGLTFPPGTKGLHYYYRGSGIDDALAAKVEVPESGRSEFMSNAIFREGTEEKAGLQIGRGKSWWEIDHLTNRVDRKQTLPGNQLLEVSCGREGEAFVVYISWATS